MIIRVNSKSEQMNDKNHNSRQNLDLNIEQNQNNEAKEKKNTEIGGSRGSYASSMVTQDFVKGNIHQKGKQIYRNNLQYSVCGSMVLAFIFSILMRLVINNIFTEYSYQMEYLS
jgi:hypothetical protein